MKGGVGDADGGESIEENGVRDGVKRCTKIEEDENGE